MLEQFNRFIYDTKNVVLNSISVITFITTIVAIGLILYVIGFPADANNMMIIQSSMDVMFEIFAVSYFIQVIYSFERIKFIRETIFEAIIMLFILLTGIGHTFFSQNLIHGLALQFFPMSEDAYREFYLVFITISMLYLVGQKFVKASSYIHIISVKPAVTFILSFVLLICLGTGLLMLPEMTVQQGSADFLSSFFTSVSASCVTGLIVVDTATYWTMKGHIVILFLMQLGGIGIVSFAAFFTTFMKQGMGIKHQVIIQDFLNSESLHSAKNMLRQVIFITIVIEALAAFLLFFTWGSNVEFEYIGKKVFYSIFHGVSAFCNAGFSLFSNGLYQDVIRESYLFHVVIGCTIIVGSIGFTTIEDVLSPIKLRERLAMPWKDWSLGTKISIHTSFALIVVGMVLFFLIERNNTLKELTMFESIISSFFQSVTTRTAGFNTLDFGQFLPSTLIFMIFLMFIGASSGSTGGGIKTSTFLLILVSAIATIRGKKNVDLGKRHISNDLLFKAFSIFSFAACYNLVMIFALSITDPNIDILRLLFEQVSAFATVGLSTGITAELSLAGKIIIILSMFFGRIGTLTLALAISTRVESTKHRYPTAHLLIG